MAAFDEALRIAEQSKDKPLVKELPDLKIDLPGGNLFDQMAVQVLFFKAAGFLSLRRPLYEEALQAYQQAGRRLAAILEVKAAQEAEPIDWSNGGIALFHQLEALRMSGFCAEKTRSTTICFTVL